MTDAGGRLVTGVPGASTSTALPVGGHQRFGRRHRARASHRRRTGDRDGRRTQAL